MKCEGMRLLLLLISLEELILFFTNGGVNKLRGGKKRTD
jgi:hypothetical protein